MRMRVIILAAGIGTRLKPFTANIPKSLFKLGKDMTILERIVEIVKRNLDAEICIVTGFQHHMIESLLPDLTFFHNPFYRVTNSIASLWFAREYLDEDVIIINSDVVIEEAVFKEVLNIENPATVLIDSSKGEDADYKVVTYDGRVIMMSKDLSNCSGEYGGITKLLKDSSIKLKCKIETMIDNEEIDEWYETALVNMILNENFVLNFLDISQFQWVEVDTADDFLTAKKIYEEEKSKNE